MSSTVVLTWDCKQAGSLIHNVQQSQAEELQRSLQSTKRGGNAWYSHSRYCGWANSRKTTTKQCRPNAIMTSRAEDEAREMRYSHEHEWDSTEGVHYDERILEGKRCDRHWRNTQAPAYTSRSVFGGVPKWLKAWRRQ